LWLQNRDPNAKRTIAAHENLTKSAVVSDTLSYHRRVYLTEEKARIAGGGEKWAGVIPRLQGASGFSPWDGKGQLAMNYQCLAAYSLLQTARFGVESMSVAETDVFTSFHDFQLRSDVVVALETSPNKGAILKFVQVRAKAIDRYDWDPRKHLTMPNPDFASHASWAIRPDLQRIAVYHSNAKRIERDGLAAPYDLETESWSVADPGALAPAEINLSRRLF
jgi:hypothetical protein